MKSLMRKILIPILILISLIGCGPQQKEDAVLHNQSFKLKEYLDAFIAENSDCLNNDITKKACADILAKNFIKDNLGDSIVCITELPLRFERMVEYNPNKYAIKFAYGKYTSKHKLSEEYDVSFQIFSIVDRDTALKLKNNENYHIRGKCYNFANKSSFKLPSGVYTESYPSISKFDKKQSIDLGTLIIKDISFELVD